MKKLSLAVLACAALSAHAADWRPTSFFADVGLADNSTRSASVGLAWAWDWRTSLWGGEVTAQTEAYISHWNARHVAGGRQSLTQIGLVPVFRLRFDQGRSDWFVEAGIGVSMLDKEYRIPGKRFSTEFNFHDTVGVGRSFGPKRESDLSLRLTHFSNAGIDKPNPGENFLQLRYSRKF